MRRSAESPASRGSRRPASRPARPAARRPAGGGGRGRSRRACAPPTSFPRPPQSPFITAPRSAFDRGPCLDPIVVVLAIFIAVATVGERRLPVVDPLPELRFFRVVFRAEVRVLGLFAGLFLRRSLTEVFRNLGIGLRFDDPVHPHVHAVWMFGFGA